MTSMIFSDEDDYDIDGWERQTTTDEPRLSELVEFYEELGFEVLLRPAALEELGQDCTDCMRAAPDRFRTIYTRRGTTAE